MAKKTPAKDMPSVDYLKKIFYIDDQWRLRNKVTRNSRALKDDLAGTVSGNGYLQTWIHGKRYQNHRLIYAMYHGKYEPDDKSIDHRDRNKLNNDPSNLNVVSRRANQNNQGMRSDNTSGVKGVCYHKQKNKWMARIKIKGKSRHLGYHIKFYKAVFARAEADIRHNTYTGTQEPQSITWLRENGYTHLVEKIYKKFDIPFQK